MKPCDCKSIADTRNLSEQGVTWNNFEIKLLPTSVFIRVKPYAEIRIPCNTFKRFAEWYLEDQEEACEI